MAMYEKCISDGNTKDIFGFNVGDKLYVASTEKRKVCEFLTDCFKIHDHNTTVHGYVYGLYGKWGTPTEYSLKWLNKRCIFIKKKDAVAWLESRTSKYMQDAIIPYGTKIIYHGTNGWENCKCYCGHYNTEDDTYNIYRGWDLCHVPKNEIEVYEW